MPITCSFTGHRPHSLRLPHDESHPAVLALKAELGKEVITLVKEQGITRFAVGLALGADLWCAEIVMALMRENPALELEVAIPFENQTEKWPRAMQKRYGQRYEEVMQSGKIIQVYKPEPEYTEGSYKRRNQYLIETCNHMLAIWNGSNSGTVMTVRIARELGKNCTVIDPTKYRELVNTEKKQEKVAKPPKAAHK